MAERAVLHQAPVMKVAHAMLATTGLVVIAALFLWVMVGSWRSLLIVVTVAAAAGLVTSSSFRETNVRGYLVG